MRTQKKALSGAILCLALGGLALVNTGCAGDRYQRSTGAYIDDKGINARVKTALFRDPNVSGFDVHVNTFRGEVQLSGFVDTPGQKEHAAALAQNVEGVRAVVNNLEVKPTRAGTSEAVGTSGASVQGATGTVIQPAPIQPAADNAVGPAPIITPAPPNIPPATVVNNRLDSSSSNFAPDRTGSISDVDRAVTSSAYQAFPDRSNLDISSHNGRVTPRGTVKSEDEKLSVARKLLAVPGVVSVDNQLQVQPPATEK